MARRALLSVVALNVALLVIYVWTATESSTITVDLRGDQLTATANGYHIEFVDDVAATGDQITYDNAGPPADSPIAIVGNWAARLRQEPLGTTWRDFTVTDLTGHTLINLPNVDFANVPDHTTIVGAVPVTDFTVRATLVRGTTPAGILLRARDQDNGLLLLVRPEQRDMLWIRIVDGQWSGPVTGGFWSKTVLSLIQDDLRILLVTQQVALAILLFLMAIGWLVTFGLGRIDRVRARRRARSGSLANTRFRLPISRPVLARQPTGSP